MARTRISGWLAAAGLVMAGCGGESHTAVENDSCFGPADTGGKAVTNTELGMPSEEADMEAWVIREQGGMMQVSTQPCLHRCAAARRTSSSASRSPGWWCAGPRPWS